MSEPFSQTILREILSIPTAPYNEQWILEYIGNFAHVHGIECINDPYGNIVLHAVQGTASPVGFVAHTDHPGFEVISCENSDTVRAFFHGGIEQEYFVGQSVVFFVDKTTRIAGSVTSVSEQESVISGRKQKVANITLREKCDLKTGTMGMWMEPGCIIDEYGFVSAPAIDDLAGIAMLLSVFLSVKSCFAPYNLYGIFTRAEEPGFIGTSAFLEGLKTTRIIPHDIPVISIEASAEAPQQGVPSKGIVIRTGDKQLCFDSFVIYSLEQTARKLAESDEGFLWQIRRMDGGTCEASVFILHGYKVGGIAIPLINYHNRDTAKKKIALERIHLRDYECGIKLCTAAACSLSGECVAQWQGKMDWLLDGREHAIARLIAGEWPTV